MTNSKVDTAYIVWSGIKSVEKIPSAHIYEFSKFISESALLEEIAQLKLYYKQILYDKNNLPQHIRESKLKEMLFNANVRLD